MQRIFVSLSMVIIFAGIGTGATPETKTGAQSPKPEIRKLLATLEDSFNRGDAKGVAACWTLKGDFVARTGERTEGRDQLQKGFQESLAAHKNSKLRILILSLRTVSDGVALVDAIADVTPPAASPLGEPGFSLVLVKHQDRWWIESARETTSRGPAPIKHIKDLEWMVGDWADEAPPPSGLSLHSTCGWTDNRAFLIRKFTVQGKSGASHAGTEVIGWDPRARRIRSWVFDSSGGFGENLWVRDGNRWLLKYSGSLADGSEVSATNVLTVVDADTLTLESKDRTVNGAKEPDLTGITIKRQHVTAGTSKSEEPAKPPSRVLP
jgi:uncharacterized protein (TIGR02246 family)